jgi:hypothetical protein
MQGKSLSRPTLPSATGIFFFDPPKLANGGYRDISQPCHRNNDEQVRPQVDRSSEERALGIDLIFRHSGGKGWKFSVESAVHLPATFASDKGSEEFGNH